MCGIAGFWTSRELTEAPERVLRNMTAAIAYRGPDGDGFYWDDTSGVALGHRRLAVVDLSEDGRQPMISRSGRFVLVFNGEIYNFERLRAVLSPLGHSFRGHSDTEVMLASFDEWGVAAAVHKFVGMFAFAVWDRVERALIFARDRFGKKPLYIHVGDHLIGFASELKALYCLPGFKPRIDRQSLTLYLRHNYVPISSINLRKCRNSFCREACALFDSRWGKPSIEDTAHTGMPERCGTAPGRCPSRDPRWIFSAVLTSYCAMLSPLRYDRRTFPSGHFFPEELIHLW